MECFIWRCCLYVVGEQHILPSDHYKCTKHPCFKNIIWSQTSKLICCWKKCQVTSILPLHSYWHYTISAYLIYQQPSKRYHQTRADFLAFIYVITASAGRKVLCFHTFCEAGKVLCEISQKSVIISNWMHYNDINIAIFLCKFSILSLWFRASQFYITTIQQDAAVRSQLYFTAAFLYMFRVLCTPIIRSTLTGGCRYS